MLQLLLCSTKLEIVYMLVHGSLLFQSVSVAVKQVSFYLFSRLNVHLWLTWLFYMESAMYYPHMCERYYHLYIVPQYSSSEGNSFVLLNYRVRETSSGQMHAHPILLLRMVSFVQGYSLLFQWFIKTSAEIYNFSVSSLAVNIYIRNIYFEI